MAQRTTLSNSALEQFPHMPDESGVRLPTACGVMSCSAATLWRLVKARKIKAHKISPRVTVFNVGSIRALLNGGH
jgi:hypothetical protein